MRSLIICLSISSLVVLGCGGTPKGTDPSTPTLDGDNTAADNAAAAEADTAAAEADKAAADKAAAEAADKAAADKAAAEAADKAAALAAAETAAYDKAKPVFDKYCAKCHQTGGKKAKPKTLEHFTMDGYPFGGHHAATISADIRKVMGAAGGKATMPIDKPGAVKGDELAAIVAWADAYDAAHPVTLTAEPPAEPAPAK